MRKYFRTGVRFSSSPSIRKRPGLLPWPFSYCRKEKRTPPGTSAKRNTPVECFVASAASTVRVGSRPGGGAPGDSPHLHHFWGFRGKTLDRLLAPNPVVSSESAENTEVGQLQRFPESLIRLKPTAHCNEFR